MRGGFPTKLRLGAEMNLVKVHAAVEGDVPRGVELRV